MSEETATTSQAPAGTPEFAVVVRGYDRDQVDSYIAELLSLVAQLRQPATVEPATVEPATVEPATVEPATVEPASSSWEALGPEVAQLLEQAETAAKARLQRAEEEAAAIVEAAQRQESQASAELEQLRSRWRELVAQLERLLTDAKQT